MMPPRAPFPPKKKHNIKLIVGALGCVGLIGIAAFVALILGVVAGAMKSSDAYAQGVARLRADATVQADLGTPIEEGMMPQGSIQTSGSRGEASLSISLSGPRGEGTGHVEAEKSGTWKLTSVVWEYGGRERQLVP